MKFTPEQLTKAKQAKSAEELLALAKENGIELTEDEAKKYFEQWHKEGEIADEELDNVAGGSQCVGGKTYSSDPPYYLIVTLPNSCPGFNDNGTGEADHNCSKCAYRKDGSGAVNYCSIRTKDNDPYR